MSRLLKFFFKFDAFGLNIHASQYNIVLEALKLSIGSMHKLYYLAFVIALSVYLLIYRVAGLLISKNILFRLFYHLPIFSPAIRLVRNIAYLTIYEK
jgi:hypothetical protein